MTKTQVKARVKKLLEQLGDIRAELSDLRDEVEETRDDIEPYEGFNDLTPEQEERQEWFDSTYYSLDEAVDSLESAESSMEEVE